MKTCTYFEFYNPVKLLCGDLALEHLPAELDTLACSRPMLLTDAVLLQIGSAAQVMDVLTGAGRDKPDIFSDIPIDSSLRVVNEIASLFRDLSCDGLIALGGGSVIDTAKGVRLVLSQEGADILSLSGLESVPRGKHIPFIVIPTTAGTGSECTGVAVIKNEEQSVKMEFLTPFVLPDAAIVDPRMTLSLPPKSTASTALDALCHAIEACTCLQKNPLSFAYATTAMELIVGNLARAVMDGGNKEARYALALASTMAGAAFSNSMVGMVHAVGHALGGVCGLPHAYAMAILLPHVMRYNAEKEPELYTPLARHLSETQSPVELVESLLREMKALCGMPISLQEAQIDPATFPRVAQIAINDGALIVNPRAAGTAEIEELLNRAYSL